MTVLRALCSAIIGTIRYLLYCCCGITDEEDSGGGRREEVEQSPERQKLVLHSTVSIQ